MDYELADRVVVITGAGGGIGSACAQAFLDEGARVVGADLRTEGLSDLAEPRRLLPVEADLTTTDGAEELAGRAIAHFGWIDVLVNSAAVVPVRTGFLEISDAEWEATLGLNLLGYVRAARAVLPHMLERGSGALVHLASEAARMPNPRLPDYSVSKAGVLMLSKALAAEFTPRGVRSNVCSPAFIRTPLYDRPGGLADSLAAEFGTDREEALREYVRMNGIPAGRLGSAEEVAATVVFLASDRSAFTSGADFVVDGGVTPVV